MPTELRNFGGELVWPNSEAYETARSVYNLRIDMRPTLVARCNNEADVLAAFRYARERDLEVATRCTGHNYVGFGSSDGGVVIDLSRMHGILVDPSTRTAWIGGGTIAGDSLTEAAKYQLAPATGVMTGPGVGLMLGGGFGHLRTRAGWAADNVLAADLITANGNLVRVSGEENPELLWALRGAGANFGIATSIDIQLHAMPATVATGTMLWGEERLEEGMRVLRAASAQASSDLSLAAWLKPADNPDNDRPYQAETPPPAMRDKPCLELWYCHMGPADAAAAEIEILRRTGRPDYESVGTTSYRDFHYRWGGQPVRQAFDAVSASMFTDKVIGILAGIAQSMSQPGSERFIELFDQRGAISRAPSIPSAQPRSIATAMSIRPCGVSLTPDMDTVEDEWVRGVLDAIMATPEGIHDACALNSMSWPAGEARLRAHYGEGFGRLVQLKRVWDPDNVFRKNQNIDPRWT